MDEHNEKMRKKVCCSTLAENKSGPLKRRAPIDTIPVTQRDRDGGNEKKVCAKELYKTDTCKRALLKRHKREVYTRL